MKIHRIVNMFCAIIAVLFLCGTTGYAQKKTRPMPQGTGDDLGEKPLVQTDSAASATALTELLHICRTVDFSDSNTTKLGTFYKAAPRIVYRGEDKTRRWKTAADYSKAEDKKGVDEVCLRINSTVNQDSNYTITAYKMEKESEGTWHVIVVNYTNKRGAAKQLAFAFLKIGRKYLLGDIDSM